MQLKVWVEVFAARQHIEDVIEVPDTEWAVMSHEEREAYKDDVFANYLSSVASGGCVEVESDS